MKNSVVISLDDLYNGPIVREAIDNDKGVSADFESGTSRIVRFVFSGDGGWTDESARKWVKNRKLNKIYYRMLDNGKVFMNHVCLSARVDKVSNSEESKSEIKDLFGSGAYDKILEIENRHGSEKPFVARVVAMDFNGKDFVVANGIKYYRDKTVAMIDEFSNLAVRLGHRNYFDSYHKRVGNTIGSYVDEQGNPAAYTYIYPHGEAGEFRENLAIASAQGYLDSYEVSMFGDPVEYESVEEDRWHKEDGARILLFKWNPTSLDYVDEGAIQGSRAVQVVNSQQDIDGDEPITILSKEGGKKLTISEILQELEGKEKIALSDFLSIPKFKEAVDSHLQLSLDRQKEDLSRNKDFILASLENIKDEDVSSSEKVAKIVNSKVTERREAIDRAIEDVSQIAKKNKIELTKDQMFMVKNNLTGEESEDEILGLCQAAQKFSNGLGGVSGMFSKEDVKKVANSKKEGYGASIEEIDPTTVKTEI